MLEIKDLKLTKKRLEIVNSLGFKNTLDILRYYPVKYENYELMAYQDFKDNERVVFIGEIISTPSSFRYGKNGSITKFKVLVEDEYEIMLTIFNRPWAKMLHLNDKLVIVGKYEAINKVVVINYFNKSPNEVLGIKPIYALKNSFTQNDIKKIIDFTLNKVEDRIVDDIPYNYLLKHHLINLKEALINIHNPKDVNSLKKAIARLKYEEFLNFYIALSIISGSTNIKLKKKKYFDDNKINQLINSLGFDLTIDQLSAINDILNDLRSDKMMYRLVEGDVGSGKTIVSIIALYANYLSGYNGVLMAPTEILAKQHYESLKLLLEPLGVKIALIYSNVTNKRDILNDSSNNKIDIIVGTHSLFSDDLLIPNLGLVITDEQQRFGVKQRRKLKDKGEEADFLLMSATPIPRTLASAIYGDMDISIIKSMPKGRKGVDTYFIKENSIRTIISNLKEILDEGRQVYIIASSIEKSETMHTKDAISLYNSLIDVFKPYKLGLLHGKLKSDEKAKIMQAFEDNMIQILVSTTVVEVGVSVKNATCMVVYDADRFGLSQLHQLRGRIQRSSYKGKCYLLSNTKEESTIKRLEVLTKTNDGFEISSEDLKLRGPGDILGTRQSGLPDFILGDIFNDTNIIKAAKDDAKEIIDNLDIEENERLYKNISQKASITYID